MMRLEVTLYDKLFLHSARRMNSMYRSNALARLRYGFSVPYDQAGSIYHHRMDSVPQYVQ